MRKKLLIFTIFLSIIVVIISIIYLGDGMTDTVKESSVIRIYLEQNPFKLNIECKDNILNISLSSFYKAAGSVKKFITINLVNRFMDTFVYRNVY